MSVAFRDRSTEGIVNRKVSERFLSNMCDYCIRRLRDVVHHHHLLLCIFCISSSLLSCDSIVAVVADDFMYEPFKVEPFFANDHCEAAVQRMKRMFRPSQSNSKIHLDHYSIETVA
jgi:hypothetical protein